MSAVTEILTSVLLTAATLFNLFPCMLGLGPKTYSPEEEGVKLNCAIVSDTHADGNPVRDRTNILRNTYAGIGRGTAKTDVLINAGDITNSGTAKEYRCMNRLIKTYVRPEYNVSCFGNHDSWHESADPDYGEAVRLFLKYLKKYGTDTDRVYYSKIIDGYYFICTGTESLDLDENAPTFSPEQLSWLDACLSEAVENGKPVFVLCHKPFRGYNGITYNYGTDGIRDIILKYKNSSVPVFVFSGHCHDFTPKCFESDGTVYFLNLPSTEYNDETEYECTELGGMGFVMEVYGHKVILRARNFIKDKFIDGYRFEVDF